MRRLVSLVAIAPLCLAPALAAAEQVYVAVPPPEPEPEPYALPPEPYPLPTAPVDHGPRQAAVATISAVSMHVPDGEGSVERAAEGVALTLSYLDRRGEFPTGFEGQATFLDGAEGGRLYDFGFSVIGSGDLRKSIAPFLSAGLDLAASSADGEAHLAIGVHGDLGLHGFISKNLYLRGSVGWLGAGDGGARAQFGLGWMFNK